MKLKSFQQVIDEKISWSIPNKPGTTSIPKDHVRLYHQTSPQNLGSIKHNGIQFSKAKGIEGPKGIYADEKGFYGKPSERPTIEFHVHKDRWHPPFVTGDDVHPKDIIAVHHPWHQHVHYIENNNDVKKNVLSGQHDDLLHDKTYGKAIRFIKKKYNG